MSLNVPVLSTKDLSDIVIAIERDGYGCVPDYIGTDCLARMQAFVDAAVTKADNEYVGFTGADSMAGSGLEELGRCEAFQSLIYGLYERATGKPAPEQDFYQVLRCLSGQSGQKNSLLFHYDSFVITALVPIRIPTSGRPGDLLMYPNTRPVRSNYLFNAFDKVLLDNRFTQGLLRSLLSSKSFGPKRIKMIPGNLYFFWGYRSVHTNEPCDIDKVRATALFHYGNPHLTSMFKKTTAETNRLAKPSTSAFGNTQQS